VTNDLWLMKTFPVFSAWVSLFAGFILEFLAGTVYLFGTYAGDLKSLFGCSQKEIQLIGTFLNAGTWAGVAGGLVLDKIGPRTTAIGGSLLMFLGYFGLFLAAQQIAFSTLNFFPLWCFFAFVAGQGGSFFVALGLKANLGNFSPSERGQVVGALQAYFGVSAGVCSLIQATFFVDRVPELLLFLALFTSITGGLVGLFVNPIASVPWAIEALRRHFWFRIRFAYGVGISIAVFILIVAILKQTITFPKDAFIACSVVAVVMCSSIMFLPIGAGALARWNTFQSQEADEIKTSDDSSPLVSSSLPQPLTGHSVREVLLSVDFYLLFFIFMICAGTSIAFVNNIFSIVMSNSFSISVTHSPIMEADLPNKAMAGTFVSLFSSFNTLGRMGFGYISDRFTKYPRPFWLVISSVVLLLCQASLCISNLSGMFFLVIVMGSAYGGVFGLMPSIIADRFGERNFGINYGMVAIAPALGSLFFSTLTAGGLADKFSFMHGITIIGADNESSIQCIGPECFLYSFITFVSCLSLCLAASLVLWRRSSKFVPQG
jgi:nitrate/nitrite transporter NarK